MGSSFNFNENERFYKEMHIAVVSDFFYTIVVTVIFFLMVISLCPVCVAALQTNPGNTVHVSF